MRINIKKEPTLDALQRENQELKERLEATEEALLVLLFGGGA